MPTWSWWRSSVSWSNFAVFFAVVCWRFEPAATITTVKWHHQNCHHSIVPFFSTDYLYISSWFRSRPRSGTHCLPPGNRKKGDFNKISTYQREKIKSKNSFSSRDLCGAKFAGFGSLFPQNRHRIPVRFRHSQVEWSSFTRRKKMKPRARKKVKAKNESGTGRNRNENFSSALGMWQHTAKNSSSVVDGRISWTAEAPKSMLLA